MTQEAVGQRRAARRPVPDHGRAPTRIGGQAVLEVADDGRGFDVTARRGRPDGLGLHTMRDRVTELGGR